MTALASGTYAQPAVDAKRLPATEVAYVAWLDIMGIESTMSRSLPISANFMLKFHATALRHKVAGVSLFPVMDGLYVATKSQDEIKVFLRHCFRDLASMFIGTIEQKHRFVVRAGLAYGPTILGGTVSKAACPEVHAVPDYARTLLMGIPMIQAHLAERHAPPFGCHVDDSARAFAPPSALPFNELWWSWFAPSDKLVATDLMAALKVYYAWCSSKSGPIAYAKDRIQAHQESAEQYFS